MKNNTKKSKKTIAIFSGYALPHLGGVENYTNNLANELIKKKYRVIIISADYQFKKEYVDESNKDIIKITLPVFKLFSSRYPIIKRNKEYKNIIKQIDKYQINSIIVNTRFYLTTLVGAKYGKKHNIPVFLIEHGSNHLTVDNKILDYFGEIYEHALTKIIKRYVNKYYGVSQEACKWQKHFKIDSNGVWYNSINDFSKGIKLTKEKDNLINIVYAGRVLKQKGIIELINAFNKLSKKYKNIRLTIAGNGNLLEQLKVENTNKKIKFLGKIDFEQLKEIYAYTDIFVYAPIWPEGLPTSILEAGLMECAVVASPQGGIKELITNEENGLMINNQAELEQAIELLINDKEKRKMLSKKLKKTVKDKFLWSSTANNIIKDIESHT